MSTGRLFALCALLLATVVVLLLERFEVIGIGFPPMGNACADGSLVNETDERPTPGPRAPISTLQLADASGQVPQTPVGEAVSWTLAVLNSGFEGLTAAEVTAKFSPAILERVPASALLDALRANGYDNAPFGLVGFANAPGQTTARAVVRNRHDRYIEIFISTEPTPPYRIHDLILGPYEPGTPGPTSTAPAAPPAPPEPANDGSSAPAEGSAAQP